MNKKCESCRADLGPSEQALWHHEYESCQMLQYVVITGNCTCRLECFQDSYTGTWHQHKDKPCPQHGATEQAEIFDEVLA